MSLTVAKLIHLVMGAALGSRELYKLCGIWSLSLFWNVHGPCSETHLVPRVSGRRLDLHNLKWSVYSSCFPNFRRIINYRRNREGQNFLPSSDHANAPFYSMLAIILIKCSKSLMLTYRRLKCHVIVHRKDLWKREKIQKKNVVMISIGL